MRSAAGPFLLDTHVWIWLFEGTAGQLDARTVARLERAAADDQVHVSAISVWEVAMLEAAGRLTLACDTHAWVDRALAQPGLVLSPLSPAILVESTRLPGRPHGDPVDRMLIATARVTGATLVTRDRSIRRYGQAGHVRILAPRAGSRRSSRGEVRRPDP